MLCSSMTNLTDALHIPDTQSSRDERRLAIQRVGVKDVRYPLQLRVAGAVQSTAARWSLDVALPAERKGTHMSRFVAWLDGLGSSGAPLDMPVLRERHAAMLQLLVMAPARLCHGVLPAMQAAGGGTIVNVASLAGLIPGLPGSTLYSASKAFLIRFSQSLAAENHATGVRVLAVCPGYVHTEFHAVLGVEERMQRLPGLFWMEADDLAARVLTALEGQGAVLVPGGLNRSIAALARLLPDSVAGRLSAAFSRRYRGRP